MAQALDDCNDHELAPYGSHPRRRGHARSLSAELAGDPAPAVSPDPEG
jgi:hypothetical protein